MHLKKGAGRPISATEAYRLIKKCMFLLNLLQNLIYDSLRHTQKTSVAKCKMKDKKLIKSKNSNYSKQKEGMIFFTVKKVMLNFKM